MTEPITPENPAARARELLAKLLPTPWYSWHDNSGTGIFRVVSRTEDGETEETEDILLREESTPELWQQTNDELAFFCAAPELVTALCDRIDALEYQLDTAKLARRTAEELILRQAEQRDSAVAVLRQAIAGGIPDSKHGPIHQALAALGVELAVVVADDAGA